MKSNTSSLMRQFDDMAMLSQDDSPVPQANTITTQDIPDVRHNMSLEDNENENEFLEFEDVNQSAITQPKNVRFDSRLNRQSLNILSQLQGGSHRAERVVTFHNKEHAVLDDQGHFDVDSSDTDEDTIAKEKFKDPTIEQVRQRQDLQEFINTTKKSQKYKPTKPFAFMVWKFSYFMDEKIQSSLVSNVLAELSQTICFVCMGFGHSKSDCITQKKRQLVFKGLPMARELNYVIDTSLSNRKVVKNEYIDLFFQFKADATVALWPFYSFVRQFFADYVNKSDGKNKQIAANIAANVLVEIESFSVRCKICNGWGHTALDKLPTRLKKNDKPEGLTDKNGKQVTIKTDKFYQTESYQCKTSERFQLMTKGFITGQQKIRQAMQEWGTAFRNESVQYFDQIKPATKALHANVDATIKWIDPNEDNQVKKFTDFQAKMEALIKERDEPQPDNQDKKQKPSKKPSKKKPKDQKDLDGDEIMQQDPDVLEFSQMAAIYAVKGKDTISLRGFGFKVNPPFPFVMFSNSTTPSLEELKEASSGGQIGLIPAGKITFEFVKAYGFSLLALTKSLYTKEQLYSLRYFCASDQAWERLVSVLYSLSGIDQFGDLTQLQASDVNYDLFKGKSMQKLTDYVPNVFVFKPNTVTTDVLFYVDEDYSAMNAVAVQKTLFSNYTKAYDEAGLVNIPDLEVAQNNKLVNQVLLSLFDTKVERDKVMVPVQKKRVKKMIQKKAK